MGVGVVRRGEEEDLSLMAASGGSSDFGGSLVATDKFVVIVHRLMVDPCEYRLCELSFWFSCTRYDTFMESVFILSTSG